MKNPFLIYRTTKGTRNISTNWKSSPMILSPDGNWLLTVANQAPRFFSANPLLTVLHIPSSTQQEISFTHARLTQLYSQAKREEEQKGEEDNNKKSEIESSSIKQVQMNQGDSSIAIDFAQDEKTKIQYALITYQGIKAYVHLDPDWIEEVSDRTLNMDNLHLLPYQDCNNYRLVLEGKTVKVCHPTKVSHLNKPDAEIVHDFPVVTARLLEKQVVFSMDSNFQGKWTQLQFEVTR